MFHLIDSDNEVLEVTKEIIVSAGFDVMAFNSSNAYLDYVHSADFVPAMAILTCCVMPGVGGFALIDKVREKYPGQKAVIITGSPLDAGVDEQGLVCVHLSKPYQAESLVAALKALNICDTACIRDQTGGALKQDCQYGLTDRCPLRTGK